MDLPRYPCLMFIQTDDGFSFGHYFRKTIWVGLTQFEINHLGREGPRRKRDDLKHGGASLSKQQLGALEYVEGHLRICELWYL